MGMAENIAGSALGNVDLNFWMVRGMARRMGVNLSEAMYEGRLSRAGFASMVECCRTCPNADQCLAYLAAASPARPGPQAIACRNAKEIAALRP